MEQGTEASIPGVSSKRCFPNTPASQWKTYIGSLATYANAAADTRRMTSVSEATDDPGPIGSLLLTGGRPDRLPNCQQS